MTSSLQWQKSSFSGGGGENCVELAAAPATVLLRESDDPGVVLRTTPARFAAFLHAIKADGSATTAP
ncbi:DUF397 domain-containing protein [Streptomyces sp. H39-S7]|uniref:DUF397 domain-containing protein n=1 Tax=Streptomyces sp. H39-S7 TaxID=3004357 RepID=UPI0022AEC269|nr:DUF397 domain-containing protein [Streptomyces sp. H39-S7]MCZ4125491.1 DUF397 domain-containing protein [Streptomyces sp. H39-S7]